MKNKILGMLIIALLGSISFAESTVHLSRMSSFTRLPSQKSKLHTVDQHNYQTLIKNLNQLIKNHNVQTQEIKDFIADGILQKYVILYELLPFLGLKKYQRINKTDIYSIDLSWPNICRIARDWVNMSPEQLLAKRVQKTKSKYSGNDKLHALNGIKKHQKKLKGILQKIDEIEISSTNRSNVYLTDSQAKYFIELCLKENGLFNVSGLKRNLQTLFLFYLRRNMQNYSGFQRICSLLVMKLLNSIMSKGIKRASICCDPNKYTSSYLVNENRIILTEDALLGKYSNFYDAAGTKATPSSFFHEITHFFHHMVGCSLSDATLMPMITYNICNSKLFLLDMFFPVLSNLKKNDTVKKIKQYLDTTIEELKESLPEGGLKELVIQGRGPNIFRLYADVVGAGFGNLLFEDNEISNLTIDTLCETERLARAIFIYAAVILNPANGNAPSNPWTNPEEMLTILGIVPISMSDVLILLEDRQSEQVYNNRHMYTNKRKKTLRSNEEDKTFRYHDVDCYKDTHNNIIAILRLLFPGEEGKDSIKGLQDCSSKMQYPKYIKFADLSNLFKSERLDHIEERNLLEECKKLLSKDTNNKELIELLNISIRNKCINSTERIIKELKAKGYDLSDYKPLLENAVNCCDDTIVRLIVGCNNVDMNVKNEDGYTPLHVAVRLGLIKVIGALLTRKDVDVNAKDANVDTPLHVAVRLGLVKVIGALLAREDVDVNAKNEDGYTPLHEAVRLGLVKVIRALLAGEDVDVNAKDANVDTPLHVAAQLGLVEVSALLVAREDINVNAVNRLGNTPLHDAAWRGSVEVVGALLKRGNVDVNVKNANGYTPLYIAVLQKNDEIIKMLKEKGAV